MKLCVGLGNPGPRYAETRHNVGFVVVNALAVHFGVELTQTRFYGTWAQVHGEAGRVGLLCPQTYMNRSGQAVVACTEFFRIALRDLVVIHDDLDLGLGMLQLAWNRGDAGHRGVASISETLGTREYWRLRVGVGRPPKGHDPSEYVLQPFLAEQLSIVQDMVERAKVATLTVLTAGPEEAQQQLNRGYDGTAART